MKKILTAVIIGLLCVSTLPIFAPQVRAEGIYTDFESGLGGWQSFTQYGGIAQLSTTYAHSGTHSVEQSGHSSGSDPYSSVGRIRFPVASILDQYELSLWVYVTERSDANAASLFGFAYGSESVSWNPWGSSSSYVYVRQSEGYQPKGNWYNPVPYGLSLNTWHQVKVMAYTNLGTVSIWLDGSLIVDNWPAFNAGEKPDYYDIECSANYYGTYVMHQYVDDVYVSDGKVSLPWRDDFNYAAKEDMKGAGWLLDEEVRISVGGGLLTLDNDGAHGCGVKYMGHFPSGINDFRVEAKSKWISRAYGSLVFYVWTQRHRYGWFADGYYPEYAFIRYSDGWSGSDDKVLRFGGYEPAINEWATMALEKRGNTFYMYQDGQLKNTYTETNSAPDELVGVSISGCWLSTVQYDYISVKTPVPEKGEPRGVFVRLGQLLGISPQKTSVTQGEVEEAIKSLVNNLASNNINIIYIGLRDDAVCYDPHLAGLDPPIGYRDGGYASGNLMYRSERYSDLVYGPLRSLPLSFDPISFLIEKAHAKSTEGKPIEVHAWFPLFLDYLYARLNPDELQPAEPGKTVMEAVRPESPEVKLRIVDMLDEILDKYSFDGVNLDYVRCDKNALGTYKQSVRKTIVDFVSLIRQRFPETVLSADLWPEEFDKIGQDYIGISRYIDVAIPMTYLAGGAGNPIIVADRVSDYAKRVFAPYLVPAIMVNQSGNALIDVEYVVQCITKTRGSATGFVLFNYDLLSKYATLDDISEQLASEPATPPWQINVEFHTDAEAYWMIFPTINFWGSFHWKTCGNPLSNKPTTLSIRTPSGKWLDFQLHGFTGDDGDFIGQLSGLAMWPGEWLLRVRDDTYGAAAIETFQVKILPGNLLFIVFSPVDMHVYDPEGRHVGVNQTGGIDIEIPGAFYSGSETEPEFVLVPNAMIGEYNLILFGTATGNYTLNVEYVTDTLATTQTLNATIVSGQTQAFAVEVSETSASLYVSANADIKPDALNLRSMGDWITTYIELSEGFSVNDINVSSIMLNNTIPADLLAPATIGDYDNDGVPDLMVKFDRAQVSQYILDHVSLTGQFTTVTLTVTGELDDGTPFMGSDTIRIVYPVKNSGKQGILPK
jgi:hypothetical protein